MQEVGQVRLVGSASMDGFVSLNYDARSTTHQMYYIVVEFLKLFLIPVPAVGCSYNPGRVNTREE